MLNNLTSLGVLPVPVRYAHARALPMTSSSRRSIARLVRPQQYDSNSGSDLFSWKKYDGIEAAVFLRHNVFVVASRSAIVGKKEHGRGEERRGGRVNPEPVRAS